MKKLIHMVTAAALLMPAAALALDDEFMFPTDSRIRMLPYDESDVYTIVTKYGYQTSVVFSPNEEIYTISIGDRSLWQIIPSGNRMFIRPMHEDVMTNMTVLTNKRSYQFDLKSVGAESTNTSIMYVAKFIYPEDMPPQRPKAEVSAYDSHMSQPPLPESPAMPVVTTSQANVMPDYTRDSTHASPMPVATVAEPAGGNYRYTYSGPDELAPLKVFDNGKSTFFKYRAADQPLPNVYLVARDGSQKPIAHYVRDGFMIVDATAGEWLLKSSAGNVMVYNEMMNPN